MPKSFIQKLQLEDRTSFMAKTFRTPHFEVSWHQHTEVELILFTEGIGQSFIGNYAGEFTTGDIFLLGSNLPHTFQKSGDIVTSAVVVQFLDDFWGKEFLQLPESQSIKQLLEHSSKGLRIIKDTKQTLAPLIKEMEHSKGFHRLLLLGECLNHISQGEDYLTLSTQEAAALNAKDQERIDSVFRYTFENFKETISLDDMSALTKMSVPAFCNYFKKRAKKTYVDFLNEIRISYACKQLINTSNSVSDIGYECGFNTLTNFHRQFRKLKGKTPHQYKIGFPGGQSEE